MQPLRGSQEQKFYFDYSTMDTALMNRLYKYIADVASKVGL